MTGTDPSGADDEACGGASPSAGPTTDPGSESGTAESGKSGLPAAVNEAVRAAVRAEFDEVLHHVVEALRRDKAFDELNDRLRKAERRLEARRERPVIVSLYRLLDRLRHLDFDPAVKSALEDDLVRILNDAGFEETGQIGEPYDPVWHEAIDGRASDGKAMITKVHTRGLSSFGDVAFRAKVEISPGPVPRHWPYLEGRHDPPAGPAKAAST